MSGNDAAKRGLLLRAERKRRRLTQAQAAELAHTSDKTIRAIEQGTFRDPSTLPALLDAYGMTEDQLMNGDPPPEKPTTQEELEALQRFPRGVFVALLVWGNILRRMDDGEQDDKIDAVTKLLLNGNE